MRPDGGCGTLRGSSETSPTIPRLAREIGVENGLAVMKFRIIIKTGSTVRSLGLGENPRR
jgi:hypothetical protein